MRRYVTPGGTGLRPVDYSRDFHATERPEAVPPGREAGSRGCFVTIVPWKPGVHDSVLHAEKTKLSS